MHLQIDKRLKTWKEKNYGISGSVCESATWFGEIKKLVFQDIAPVAEITIILLPTTLQSKKRNENDFFPYTIDRYAT